ncbi:helix-turn-helix transcriptional regulator [Pseudoalteromonas sp. NEC-BIFX-2020_002]|uniref:helix-turn-helix domain-containing protein n=1 Tax=Pseudoalteromonas sp. NEC-BIFX-2020_002 TaxID=2732353 RepID=UPI0014775EC1|nr:helix-turn-helix transcriptional regulator [Pseudoalteromonas sp. NEC-BIFX-2020_002]NNG45009.1 helix-turn-helix transcriptional regulator [Pseudoalteromonas sp. NEC-BIFX-2020_002]
MTAFNQYLKALRERKFLDIGTVAERTGVHRNTQSKYEDSRDPPFDYLVEFAALVDVPLDEMLIKRLEDSKASEYAINKAVKALEPGKKGYYEVKSVNEVTPGYGITDDLIRVELSEISHKLIPPGATVFVDTSAKYVDANNMYGFLNPMNGSYFAARLVLTNTSLKLVFDNSERKDLIFSVEGGETESRYILKTLGLLGKIVKAELIF